MNRPKQNSKEVNERVAKILAPKVKQWLESEGENFSLEIVEKDLADAVDYKHCGYEIAKYLDDQCGYMPDAELVEILDDVVYIRNTEYKKLYVEWAKANNLKAPEINSTVEWSRRSDLKQGVVKEHRENEYRSVVDFLGKKDFIIEWDELKLIVARE